MGFNLQDFRAALKKELSTKTSNMLNCATEHQPLVPNFVSKDSEIDISEMQTSVFSKRGLSLQARRPLNESFDTRNED